MAPSTPPAARIASALARGRETAVDTVAAASAAAATVSGAVPGVKGEVAGEAGARPSGDAPREGTKADGAMVGERDRRGERDGGGHWKARVLPGRVELRVWKRGREAGNKTVAHSSSQQ